MPLLNSSEYVLNNLLFYIKTSTVEGINRQVVEDAIATIDREQFTFGESAERVVGQIDVYGAAKISHSAPPPEVAKKMLRAIDYLPANRVLHIGSGSGYVTALLSQCAREVVAVEKSPSLTKIAARIISDLYIQNVEFINKDANTPLGLDSLFDVIVINSPSIKNKDCFLNDLVLDGQIICLEIAENNLTKLTSYKNRGKGTLEKVELGLVDFSISKNDALIDFGFVDQETLQKAKINAQKNQTYIIDEIRRLVVFDDDELYRSIAEKTTCS